MSSGKFCALKKKVYKHVSFQIYSISILRSLQWDAWFQLSLLCHSPFLFPSQKLFFLPQRMGTKSFLLLENRGFAMSCVHLAIFFLGLFLVKRALLRIFCVPAHKFDVL